MLELIDRDYMVFLLACVIPILLAQWACFPRLFAAHLPELVVPAAVMTVWFSILDIWAVRCGVWRFPKDFLVSIYIDVLPLEEPVFYFVTSLLVTHTLLSSERVIANGWSIKAANAP
jgi:lycopene cyclase domain-containing protein